MGGIKLLGGGFNPSIKRCQYGKIGKTGDGVLRLRLPALHQSLTGWIPIYVASPIKPHIYHAQILVYLGLSENMVPLLE